MSSEALALLSDPEYRVAYDTHHLRAVAILCIVLAILFFGLRCVSKLIGRNQFGFDDGLLLVSVIFNVALDALSIGNVSLFRYLVDILNSVRNPRQWWDWPPSSCPFCGSP
ncbi:hypothetical protein K461DRAFT_270701 [Myriangium duriaei CBS 260.36]|uniref:Uncharacterized protein n=1 Tax=Myriangium duriaei CBS 260.36 TaxID=1168546 RepID=A0A9P4IX52_9PEZI|nr:hypothetical protein K461DRAFT_270701 [Myriangium duriaei CBS 260.36]